MPTSKKRRKKKKSLSAVKVSPMRPARNEKISTDIAAEMRTGMQYHQAGRLHKADAIYRKVLSVAPNHPDALHMLGLVAHQANKNDEAAAFVEKAISIDPENSAFRNNLGNVYVALNRFDDAVACFEKTIHIAPKTVETHINLGNALKYQGKTAAAEKSYRKALSVDPESVSAYYNLAQLKHFGEKDDTFTILESIHKKRPLSDKQSIERHFALGKMYADIEAHESAFEHYHSGNAYRKRTMENRFNMDAFEKQIALFMKAFDADFFNRNKDTGNRTQIPVFIVGMPRSGTSLVEQILSSHPGVFGAGELPLINRMVNAFLSQHDGLPFDRILEAFDENRVKTAAGQYIDALKPIPEGTVRVTDKLPGNFLNLWFIARLFPKAKIIHCKRHPMDTCLSCYFTHFKQPLPYKNDLYTLGRYYGQYEKLMAHWKAVLPVSMLEIQYESLVESQEMLSKKMLAFCELDWDERCLSFYNNDRPVTTASGMQVRRRIYTSSVGRWKKYERFLRPLIESLEINADMAMQ
jgi:tetratricopeptide (TPR) repeat protein